MTQEEKNPVLDLSTIKTKINGKDCTITVNKLKWRHITQVSGDILAIVSNYVKGGNPDVIANIDKIMKLIVEIKVDGTGELVDQGELDIDILGKVVEVIVEINFIQSASYWRPVVEKVNNLITQAQNSK